MMKANVITIFFMAIAMSASLCQAESQPTKSETTQYILDKLKEDTTAFDYNYVFSDDSCTLHMNDILVDLKSSQIYLADLTNNEYAPIRGYYVELKCTKKGCMDKDGSHHLSMMYLGDKQSWNRDYLEKIVKALNHLKSLCLGKKELF